MQLLIFTILAFLLGVAIGNIWLGSGIWIIILISLVVIILLSRNWKLCLCILLALFGGWLYVFQINQNFEHARNEFGQSVGWDGFNHEISGEAGSLISTSEYSRKYRVLVAKIDGEILSEPISVSLSMAPNLSLLPGDSFWAMGKFAFPRDTDEYASEKQLWIRRMIAEFQSFQIKKTPPEKYGVFTRLQLWFDSRLAEIFPQSGHEILAGILLGQRSSMSPEMRDNLRSSGLMHIMVVSGGNVIMLIVFLSLFIRSLPVFIRIGIIAFTIISFVLLVGGDAPVWRAAIMGIVGYSASLWGFQFQRFFLPLLVAFILTLVNPLTLMYDIGFQLSFLSVLCIIAWGKSLTKFFSFLGPFFSEAMALTIAATIGTLPITLFYFGAFSVVAPISNLFAAPAIPILMYGGIATLFASAFSHTLAVWIGYIPWIATTYLTKVITFFGSLSWAQFAFELGSFRQYFMIVAFCCLVGALVKSGMKKKTRKNSPHTSLDI